MVTANNGAASDSRAGDVSSETACHLTRWGYVESGVAGLIVVFVVGGSLPLWWGMTRPFGLFSTTALATLSLVMWISLWAGLSLLHGRIRTVR
jgi:hypothetical protein